MTASSSTSRPAGSRGRPWWTSACVDHLTEAIGPCFDGQDLAARRSPPGVPWPRRRRCSPRAEEECMTSTNFDPVGYKRSTHDQWEAAAGAWRRWQPVIDGWLREGTDLMLDLAGVQAGARVVDVAAGAGGQSFAAARRVGPQGEVLATDLSENLVRYLEQDAAAAGLTQVRAAVMDGEDVRVPPGRFDAVICRLGLIYLPDRKAALGGIRAALRPGGRLGAIVYSTPEANRFFSLPVSIIRRAAQLPPPLQ